MSWSDWLKDRWKGVQDTLIGALILYGITSLITIGVIVKFHEYLSGNIKINIYTLLLVFLSGVFITVSYSFYNERVKTKKVRKKNTYGQYFSVGWEWYWLHGNEVSLRSLTSVCPNCKTELIIDNRSP